MVMFYRVNNGLKEPMLLVLSQKLEDMEEEHLPIRILHLSLRHGFPQSLFEMV